MILLPRPIPAEPTMIAHQVGRENYELVLCLKGQAFAVRWCDELPEIHAAIAIFHADPSRFTPIEHAQL